MKWDMDWIKSELGGPVRRVGHAREIDEIVRLYGVYYGPRPRMWLTKRRGRGRIGPPEADSPLLTKKLNQGGEPLHGLWPSAELRVAADK
jgi:hypothetical protein